MTITNKTLKQKWKAFNRGELNNEQKDNLLQHLASYLNDVQFEANKQTKQYQALEGYKESGYSLIKLSILSIPTYNMWRALLAKKKVFKVSRRKGFVVNYVLGDNVKQVEECYYQWKVDQVDVPLWKVLLIKILLKGEYINENMERKIRVIERNR